MKRVINYLTIIAAFLLLAAIKLDAQQLNAGLSLGRGGLEGFYLKLGNYFRVPQKEIVVVRDSRLPDEEVPVVLFVARNAGVPPREVARLRRHGFSWMDITYHFGLSPEIYFPGRFSHGPSFGGRGYFGNRHRGYANISDYDIINAVNARFNSEHYDRRGRGGEEDDHYKYHDRDNWNNNNNGSYNGNHGSYNDNNGSYNDNNGNNGNWNDNNGNWNDNYGNGNDNNGNLNNYHKHSH